MALAARPHGCKIQSRNAIAHQCRHIRFGNCTAKWHATKETAKERSGVSCENPQPRRVGGKNAKSGSRDRPRNFAPILHRKGPLHCAGKRRIPAALKRADEGGRYRVSVPSAPDGQGQSAAGPKHPRYLERRFHPVIKELKTLMTEHSIERVVWERQGFSFAQSPANLRAPDWFQRAGDGKHGRVSINTNNLSPRANTLSGDSCRHACPAGEVQNATVSRKSGTPDQLFRPRLKLDRNDELLVRARG
jgi:hypothetical protein